MSRLEGFLKAARSGSGTAGTLVAASVMVAAMVMVGLGIAVLAVVGLLWAVAPLLGAGFMEWFAEMRPARTVAIWTLIPAVVAAAAATPVLLRARSQHLTESDPSPVSDRR